MTTLESGAAGSPLRWVYDDSTDPSTLTVFDAEAEDRTTAWLTVGADVAVPLEERR